MRMKKVKNSDLLHDIIKAIYTVASRRTSSKFADETIGSTINTLEGKYDFLRHIQVKTKDMASGGFAINVNPEIDTINPSRIGKAIESILRVVYNDMNEEAGLYFISELKNVAGDETTLGIIECNVDLDQIQIEQHHAFRRKERKKQIQQQAQYGAVKKQENLLGYTWSDVAKWKHEANSKFCTLYDDKGNVVDRLNLDRIIQNYVEKLSTYVDVDPAEIEKQTRIYEKEYNLLRLMLERDMDAETAMHMLNLSKEDLNQIIRKLSQMEMLQYIDQNTIEITEIGVSYISKKEKNKEHKNKDTKEQIEVA